MTSEPFTTPVELRAIADSGDRLRRTVPLMAITFIVAFVACVAVTNLLLGNLLLGCLLGVVLGAVLCWTVFTGQKTTSGRENQRLRLTPKGMIATDGVLTTRMYWKDVRVVTTPKGSSRVGIIGDATLSGNPQGDPQILNRYANLTNNPEDFLRGEKIEDRDGALFPGDFEQTWRQGVIGSWLHHYRPDLHPDYRAPEPEDGVEDGAEDGLAAETDAGVADGGADGGAPNSSPDPQ
ncbi:hypothetical protein [Corynebacterium terpenotabidum]|uniref:Uncharacterized protein n=1 Tax=Corynebacterium terpenotabidum Y-11 TaxID=1200352 RepID=S4XLU8_9CORY|nr:hypothetical protein [Corynebacterium terpenotabidum]AGP31573.1 hypothetical protein A606_09670 [Corynebacterium terpenotabidum Y-11]